MQSGLRGKQRFIHYVFLNKILIIIIIIIIIIYYNIIIIIVLSFMASLLLCPFVKVIPLCALVKSTNKSMISS